eukprot:10800128-Prorocentrum_lima.AAC.1
MCIRDSTKEALELAHKIATCRDELAQAAAVPELELFPFSTGLRTLLSSCIGDAAYASPGDLAQSLVQAVAYLDKVQHDMPKVVPA